jgi:hypothetical protein
MHRYPRRRRLRLGLAAVLAGLLAGSLAVVAPAGAHPHDEERPLEFGNRRHNHCIPPSNIHNHALDPGSADWLWGYEYVSANQRFIKSEGRSVANNTDVSQTVTFSSQTAQTHTVTTTHTETAKITKAFKILTVEATFQLSRAVTDTTTTTIGISTTVVVPPHTRVQADYGVYVYDVAFWFNVFFRRGAQSPPQPCVRQGLSGHHLLTVPTRDQGWEVGFIPLSATGGWTFI